MKEVIDKWIKEVLRVRVNGMQRYRLIIRGY
jgi:hypothetical protein